MAVITAETGDGYRTDVTMGAHRLVADEPPEIGGTDTGPTPYDLLAAALATCTSMTLRFYADREKIALTRVRVDVEHGRKHAKDCIDCLSQSGYIHDFRVSLALEGDLTEEQRQKLLEVAGRCPVSKTLKNEIRVEHALQPDSP